MAKSPKNWSPSEEKLEKVLQELHERLRDAGAAEAHLVDDLLTEVLDYETSLDLYIASLDELIGWAQMAKDRFVKLQKTGR